MSTSTPTDTQPRTGGPQDLGDHVAHIIRKGDQMRGYVMGEEVEALCGTRFVPSRDPERYPVCQSCVEALGRLRR